MSKYQSALSYLIPFIISLSVCVMLVKQVRGIALSHEDNTRTFYSFAVDLEDYKIPGKNGGRGFSQISWREDFLTLLKNTLIPMNSNMQCSTCPVHGQRDGSCYHP
jgi:hypothetical protein